ncbi:PLP-dependent aminotransferase family protein [uncultured Microscilla sp.]|uniref:MocR-like pyridoxine biosynthesis transcription factor PdxR n=1 Tax=uncultured Microscilla sp. TaxID=432653 RepID=UPI0026147804|nr:PLP-dependent aminotransferase family protein [uncultured Microscilla sp.]
MLPLINPQSPTPLFDQIYSFFKQSIIDGSMAKGAKLPSIRQLSRSLGVSNNTVIAAYQQLNDEGYLVNIPRKGLFVANLKTEEVYPKGEPTIVRLTLPQVLTDKPRAEYAFNLNQAAIDEASFPMKEWRKCINWALDKPSLQYGGYFGEPTLKKTLATYLFQSRGVKAQPEQIVIGSGTIQLMGLLATLFKNRAKGKGVRQIAFEEPGYQSSRQIWLDYGYQALPIKVNEQTGIRLDLLAPHQPDLVYLTPSHQYPLGCIMPVAHRLQVLQWAQEKHSYLIEDDYDSEFRFKGKPIPALQALDTHERVIYSGTFSKAFLPALRLAYIVLPPHLLLYLQDLQHLGQSASINMQRAMAIFMQEGYWDRHLRKMRKVYRQKYEYTVGYIQEVFQKKITLTYHYAGLNVLMKVHSNNGEQILVDKARQANVWLMGKSDSWLLPSNIPDTPHLSFGFGKLTLEQIKEAVDALYKAWFG